MEIIATVWVIGLAAYVFIPVISESRAAAANAMCMTNLKEIGTALSEYMTSHENRWPFATKLRSFSLKDKSERWPTLPVALREYVSEASPAWQCPSDSRRLAADDPLMKANPGAKTYYESEGLSYEWWWGESRGGVKIGEESISSAKGFGYGRPDQKVLSDFEPFHEVAGGAAFNVLFADFRVRTVQGYAR